MMVLWLIFCSVVSATSANENSKEVKVPLNKFSIDPAPAMLLQTYDGPTKHPRYTTKDVSAYKDLYKDSRWDMMWYVHDYRTSDMPVMDLNVVPVYQKDITGKGINIAVVDRGFDAENPDIAANFRKELSYDPFSRTNGVPINHEKQNHGIKAGSIIGMIANNEKCGVGIAYDAKIAGVSHSRARINPLISTSYNIALAFIANLQDFDIYSNSWGVIDDGQTMTQMGLSSIESFALSIGATKGRKGKGAIYTFASGNGGKLDHCGADFMINWEHTIAIAGASQFGKISMTGERCAAIFATAYGGYESRNEQSIVSLDIGEWCSSFAGTSAATPLATGIIALILEANPNLSGRDVMHIITMGSEVAPLADNKDTWFKNGRGFWVSDHFGFGLMNAWNMVKLAKEWDTVPKKRSCVFSIDFKKTPIITFNKFKNITIDIDACKGTEEEVNYLEIIEVAATINYAYRGSLSLYLISPAGTRVMLLGNRPKDHDNNGLKDWILKSVLTWAENPRGKWRIQAHINDKPRGWKFRHDPTGEIVSFRFAIHGTKEQPEHYKKPRVRTYAAFRLPNGRTSED